MKIKVRYFSLIVLMIFLVAPALKAKEMESQSRSSDIIGDAGPSEALIGDIVKRDKGIAACKNVARKEWLDIRSGDNKDQRQFIYDCLKSGYIGERSVSPEILDKDAVAPNSLGISLEKFNIWYYERDSGGKQRAGINIYAPDGGLISWIVVGFNPSSCSSPEGYKWVMRLKLDSSMPVNQNAVWTWDMPEGAEFSNTSCLDILAAG